MSENYRFFQNKDCEFFPCHVTKNIDDFNCLFCYCPLYALGKKCGGDYIFLENGTKSCENCIFPHIRQNYDSVNARFPEIKDMILGE